VASRPAEPKQEPTEPTVRQAVAAVLDSGVDADMTTVLLLSTHLGPASRVRELDTPARSAALRAWVTRTWPDRDSPQHARAAHAVRAVGGYWRSKGWVEGDPEQWVD
jgi:hypothetical protein